MQANRESKRGEKETAWVKEQYDNMPTGSPPRELDADDASSSDEEYERFCHPGVLLLSGVTNATPDTKAKEYFKDYKLSSISKDKGKHTTTFVVTFEDDDGASKALNQLKHVEWKTGNIVQKFTLSRDLNPRFKTFHITGYNNFQNRDGIRYRVEKEFGKYGKILYLHFPTEDEDEKDAHAFLYAEMNNQYVDLSAKRLGQQVKMRGLEVKECHMKGKEIKKMSHFFNW